MKIRLDDWLVIYGLPGGHESVRSTENWSEWEDMQYETTLGDYAEKDKATILKKAERLGPSLHDPEWCGKCMGNICEATF